MEDRSTGTGRCQRCGNTRPGTDYEFWCGALAKATDPAPLGLSERASVTSEGTTTTFRIGGQDAAFICDQCIEEAQRRLRRNILLFAAINFVVLAAGSVSYGVVENEPGGVVSFAVMALLFGPGTAALILWQIRRNPDFAREGTGYKLAMKARGPALRAEGYNRFWNQKQYEALLSQTIVGIRMAEVRAFHLDLSWEFPPPLPTQEQMRGMLAYVMKEENPELVAAGGGIPDSVPVTVSVSETRAASMRNVRENGDRDHPGSDVVIQFGSLQLRRGDAELDVPFLLATHLSRQGEPLALAGPDLTLVPAG